MWRTGRFLGPPSFSPFSDETDRGYSNRAENDRNGEHAVWSSFSHVFGVTSILSFGNSECALFLSRPCSNRGRVGADLTVNYAYVRCYSLVAPKVLRRSFPRCCQHAFIFEKWSSFLLCIERHENTRQLRARYLIDTVLFWNSS